MPSLENETTDAWPPGSESGSFSTKALNADGLLRPYYAVARCSSNMAELPGSKGGKER